MGQAQPRVESVAGPAFEVAAVLASSSTTVVFDYDATLSSVVGAVLG